MDNDSSKIFEQTYLQQLQQQAPVKYVYSKYTEQQAHVIAEEYWKEFQAKLPNVMQTLFGIKPSKLVTNNTHTLSAEYHAVCEMKCGYHHWVKYNISYQHTENVEYGYQDYAGQWHHAYTRPETSYSSESSGGMASCDVVDADFYERKTDSPILHRWNVPNEKNTFDCSHYDVPADTKPSNFNGVVTSSSNTDWVKLETKCKAHLAKEVRSQLQAGVRAGTVGYYDNVVTDACTMTKRVLLWPFYFANFQVNDHVFTVRIDAANGFVNLFLDNPQGITTPKDVTNSRLQVIEKREGKRDDKEAKHNEYVRETGIDEDKLGKYSLICGILSMFIPVILSFVSIFFGVKAIKYADEGRGKGIAGIVISVLILLVYVFYFVSGLILQLNSPEATALLTLLRM